MTLSVPRESELIATVLGRVDLAAVARRIVEGYLPSVPGYARMPDTLVHGQILDITHRNLDLCVRCMIDGRDPTDTELAAMGESAKRRGREGLPLQDVLHAYRLGARVAWAAMMEAASGEEEDRALLHVADRVMRYVDLVSTVVTLAYVDEREQLVSEQEGRARGLLDALLDPLASGDELRRLADRAGFALAATYCPFALSVPGASASEHGRIAQDLRSRGVLALTEGDRVSGLAQATVDACVLGRTGAMLTLGDAVSREELRAHLELARLRVHTARRLGRTGRVDQADLLPALLLAHSPRLAAALRERVLGPLEDYAARRSAELLTTLEVFVDYGLDRRGAAERLTVHANTLDYRLRRIEQLTGLNLGNPEELAMVVLALTQRRLDGVPEAR